LRWVLRLSAKIASFSEGQLRNMPDVTPRRASRALFAKVMIALWLGLYFVQVCSSWSNVDGFEMEFDQGVAPAVGGI
jgi:hypothetical protein